MDVFARWRPLADAEDAHAPIDHTTTSTSHGSPLLSISINRHGASSSSSAPGDGAWKSAAAFATVFEAHDDNAAVYAKVVQPSIARVLQGESASFFAYGHSGSGKTHTIMGYDQTPGGLGLSLAAARQLFDQLQMHAQRAPRPLAVGLSLLELRGKAAFDLLNGGVECHIREGPDGKTHIRARTEMLEGGKVRVRPILQRACWTYESFCEELRRGLARRAVGSSSVHGQSSRTHAVLRLELVSQQLVDAREALLHRQSELVPVGKRATDIAIEEQSRGYVRTAEGKWAPNPEYAVDQARIDAAAAEQAEFEARVEAAEQQVARVYRLCGGESGLGGSLVLVDLAGAEYHRGNAAALARARGVAQSPQEKQEGRQINADLLALKEVIRAWSARHARIPFRSSPLTMVLREQFLAAGHAPAAMIVTCSPAGHQYAATLNSLKYGAVVGAATK